MMTLKKINDLFPALVRTVMIALMALASLLLAGLPSAQAAGMLCSICRTSVPTQFLNPDGTFNASDGGGALQWQAQNCTPPICYESEEEAADRFAGTAAAQGFIVCRPGGNNCVGGPTTGSPTELRDPFNNATIPQIVGFFINLLMGISGSLALLMFVWGGFRMVTSAGNEKVYSAGLNSLKFAALGLLVIFASYAVLNFILNAIGGA